MMAFPRSCVYSADEKECQACIVGGRGGPAQAQSGLQTRTAGRRSLSPIYTTHPATRAVHSADSSPFSTPSPRATGAHTDGWVSPSSAALGRRGSDGLPENRMDRESEVYKMIQENRASREPPRQSTRFRLLQEALETDQEGAAVRFPGLSPSAPVTRVSKYYVCERCGSSIVADAVKIWDGCYRHRDCYACADCGLNLGMRGHFWAGGQMYCEKHAQERFQAAEGSS
ncbi:PDZ and LIM domain protein 2-like isoform X2 [Heptranchias perlo]|uniref:PDZ and LIM domain protein 2-like isoform X2 n=1 Tax=Heptranchias perlo TaxID=212740 RepID=UPI0035593D63